MHKHHGRTDRLVPHLIAENAETRDALSAQELLLPCLPFRVGRETRHLRAISTTYLPREERRNRRTPPTNDLYLAEPDGRLFISRQHFLIHRDDDGRYYVLDRGSTLGTLVGGRKIGGRKKPGKVVLKPGDLIIPGGNRSPFVFRFELRPARSLLLPDVTASCPVSGIR